MFGHLFIRLKNRAHLPTLCAFILLLVSSDQLFAQSESQSTEQGATYRLLVLGDSLSAGYGLMQAQSWVSLLQNIWREESQPIDVINAAISGETTDGGLARLPRLLEQHNPTHVLIELGGNDGLQGHPVPKIKQNLAQIIALVRQANAQPILQDMEIPSNYGRRYNQMFADNYESLAQSEQVPLIPFFLLDIALKPELMQRDGIHPTAEAQPQIAHFMQQQLEPLLLNDSQG